MVLLSAPGLGNGFPGVCSITKHMRSKWAMTKDNSGLCQRLQCVTGHKKFNCTKSLLFVTPRTVSCQAPLSVEFSRQEHWSGLLCPPSGDLPNRRMEPRSPTLQADSLSLSHKGSPTYMTNTIKTLKIGMVGREGTGRIQETWVQSSSEEDSLEEGTATHSSVLA